MKKFIGLILACSTSLLAFGQNWAPVGATWYYEIVYPFSPQLSFIKYESVGDTTILSITCKIITVTDGTTGYGYLIGHFDTAYTYEENGKIYVFNPFNNGFSLIYDFGAGPGSGWTTTWDTCTFERMILSIDSIDVNGNTVKTLSYGGLKILAGIGGERTLFHGLGEVNCEPPDTIIYELPFIQRLRCYEDSILGYYNTGVAPSCDYITGIESYKNPYNEAIIYPNPAKKEITIKLKNQTKKYYMIRVYSLLGEMITSMKTNEESIHLPLINIPSGHYYIHISDGMNENYLRKFVINKP